MPHEIRSIAATIALAVDVDAAAFTVAVAIEILIEYIYYIITGNSRVLSSCAEKRVQRLLLRRNQR